MNETTNRVFNIGTRRLKHMTMLSRPHERLITDFKFPNNIDDKYDIEVTSTPKNSISKFQLFINGTQQTYDLINVVPNYRRFLHLKSVFGRYKGFSIKTHKTGEREHRIYTFPYTTKCTYRGLCFLELKTEREIPRRIDSFNKSTIGSIEKDFIPYFLYMSEIVDLYDQTEKDYYETLHIVKVDNLKKKLK